MTNTPTPTPRAIWDAYVTQNWMQTVERPLGRRGMMITTENPNAHLARDLRYQGYANGCYVIACRDEHLTAWAKVKLVNLGKNITIFARSLGIEREVSIEFVTQPKQEKF